MPITQMIAALIAQEITLRQAVQALMSRPLKEE
jgi:glycerol-3-phosphate dehydrogenase